MESNEKLNKVTKSFNYPINYIFKQLTWFFVITTISLVGYFLVIDIIDKYIVENLLLPKDFSFPFLVDVLFYVSYLFSVRSFCLFSIKFKYAFKQAAISSLGLGILIYHSSNLKNYTFLKDSLTNTPYICYLGAILLFLILFYAYHKSLQHIINPLKNNNRNKQTLILDSEIKKEKEDVLNYKIISKKLSEAINENDFSNDTFSFGVIGPWGNGKSSFLGLLEGNLKSSDTHNLIIRFSPSINHKENEIINEFISVINENLSPLSAKLSPKLIEYAQHLTNAYNDKNILGLINIKQGVNVSKSASALFNEINDCIQNIGKKIIILIDDLDRLEPKEILQVFKIIRSTASFKNTVFVMGIDKEYTIQRLISSGEIHNSSYLDKFFQLEVHLPELDNKIVQDYFIKQIVSLTNKHTEEDFKQFVFESLFEEFIINIRDAKRLLNQLRFDYNFDTEIQFNEFIDLTILKIKFPGCFKWLLNNLENKNIFDKKEYCYTLKKSILNKTSTELDFIPLDLSNKQKINISEYKIASIFFDPESKIVPPSSVITLKDKVSFITLLVSLFSDNFIKNKQYTFQNFLNIKEVLELKEYKDKLPNKEFLAFLNENTSETKLLSKPDILSNEAKESQFFEKCHILAATDEQNLKKSIRSILLISDYTTTLIQIIIFGIFKKIISKDTVKKDFAWFPLLMDELELTNFDRLNTIRYLKEQDNKHGFTFSQLGHEGTIKKMIEEWINGYFTNFYTKEKHQTTLFIKYFDDNNLIKKSNCIESYKKLIKENYLRFANLLVVNTTNYEDMYSIKQDILDTVDFKWLLELYKNEYQKKSNDELEDIINLLKISLFYDKYEIKDMRYNLKSEKIYKTLNDGFKTEQPVNAPDDLIFIMENSSYEAAEKNNKSKLRNNIFKDYQDKKIIWLQGKMNLNNSILLVNGTKFKITKDKVGFDNTSHSILYSSKNRIINI